MEFSPSDAAFEGFRLARRRPLTLVALSVIGLISAFALTWVMDASGYMRAMAEFSASANPEAAVFGVMGPVFRFLIGLTLIGCFASAFSASAVYRGVLRPQEHGVLGLALGGDELRLLGLAFAVVLLAAALMFALIVALSLVLAVLGLAGSPFMISLVIDTALAGAGVWLGTRLSFAGPETFARRRISLFGSWALTRGHFPALLGCYALTLFLGVLVFFITFVIAITIASLVTGTPFPQALGEFFAARPGAAIDLWSPVRVAYTLVASLFGGLLTMVTTAPAAEAYRQMHGGDQSQAEAFS
jgi:hypothetical protein